MPLLETPPNPAPNATDPQVPGANPAGANAPAPDANGSEPQPRLKFTTRRFGEIEEHELLHLLDSIDDEISRARFRESIYVSVILCLAIAWFAFYGPRVLFHEGRIANPPEQVAKLNKELPFIELPKSLVHKPPPKAPISDQNRVAQNVKPTPPVKTPEPPRGAPLPPAPQPQQHQAPPQPVQHEAPAPPPPSRQAQSTPIPDAPKPTNPGTGKPNFATPGQSLKDLAAGARAGGGGAYGTGSPAPHNGLQSGAEILSDTLGVDFGPWLKRIRPPIMGSWVPLIPEETRPPLNKTGWTVLIVTINHDGTIADMHLKDSSRDVAIDRAAWGAITGVGQLPSLPKDYTAANLVLRMTFVVGREGDDTAR